MVSMVSRMPHPYTANDAADFVWRTRNGEIGKCVYAITKAENGAFMTGADLLILLSDIDGLYTAPPHLDPDAQFLEAIAEITPEIEAMLALLASEYLAYLAGRRIDPE